MKTLFQILCGLLTYGSLQAQTSDAEIRTLRHKLDSVHIAFNQEEDVNVCIQIAKDLMNIVGSTDSSVLQTQGIMFGNIANLYAKQNKTKETHNYLSRITNPKHKTISEDRVTLTFLGIGNTEEGLAMMKRVLDTRLTTENRIAPDDCYTYAQTLILYLKHIDEKTYIKQAEQYLEPLYMSNGNYFESDIGMRLSKPDIAVTEQFFFQYAKILFAKGQKENVAALIEGAHQNGSLPSDLVYGVCKVLDRTGELNKKVEQMNEEREISFSKQFASLLAKPDINGKVWQETDFKGKYVVLDFWGSWCLPCRGGHPNLIKVYDKYKDSGFEIIGIAHEFPKDIAMAKKSWMEAVESDKINWVHLLNNVDLETFNAVKGFNIGVFPTKILLDQEGREIGRFYGGLKDGFEAKLISLFGF